MNSIFGITNPVISNKLSTLNMPTSPRESPITVPVPIIQEEEEISSNEIEKKLLNEVSLTLISLIKTNINLPSFELTEDEKIWINLIISNSPDSLAPLDSFLNNVLSSRNLSIENIPEMIQLFANVFNKISLEQNIANSHNIYVLIKFIMDVIIDILPLSYLEIIIIKCVSDSSLSLLSTVLADSISSNKSVLPINTNTSSDVVFQEISANGISQGVEPDVSINISNKCCVPLKFW
jgi:hypothetical protein